MVKINFILFESFLWIFFLIFIIETGAYMCNNGTPQACICSSQNETFKNAKDCNALIGISNLTVVRLTAKNLDLSQHLYYGEPYETYFKRRIANRISDYCRARD